MTLITHIFRLLLLYLCAAPAIAEDISIHLKWYHKFQFAGYYAAQTQGYFEEEGYQVTLLEGGPETNHIHSLINNTSEYAVFSSESLNSLALNAPIVIVASIFQHAPEALITLKDNNVESLTDFRGKTLMLADPNISGHIASMLLKNGLHPGDYKKLDYDGDVRRLINGDVFAIYGYVSNEPFSIEQLGYEVDVFRPQDFNINFYGDSLVTSQSELDENPERVAAIRRAVIRGWSYAIKNTDEIIQHILSLPTENPAPFNLEHQRFEANATIDLIDANQIPIGLSSPTRWAAMIDTYNQVNNGQAVFKPGTIYNEFHQDKQWVQYFFISLAIAIVLITTLYFWNRTLKARLDVAIESLEKAVFEDNLTSMKNRPALILFIEECRLKQHKNEYLAILDISGLQKINKEKGFREADQLIRKVAEGLTEHRFKSSKVYSLYAGKFAVVAKSSQYEKFAANINNLVAKITQDINTISLRSGAVKLDLTLDNSSLTTRAELALQHAKDTSAETLVFFDQSFAERIEKREALLVDVLRGIENNEFVPFYQPKINYKTGTIQGVEALVRWNHPEQGLLLPGQFLPVVETAPEIMNKLEVAIFNGVMTEAPKLIAYFSKNSDFRISINLSSIQFNRTNLVHDLLEGCKFHGVHPSHIEFELTESLMLENLSMAIEISGELQAAEFSVALDDFGTGYSSLAYIQNLPVNVIKLDYSFVKKIPADKRSGFVVEHIISLAHKLNLEIVAEGVEQKVQLDYLGNLGVDIIQGFYFYKPIALVDLCMLEREVNVDSYKIS